MLHLKTGTISSIVGVLLIVILTAAAPGAVVTFNIVPTSSSLTVSGDFMNQLLATQTSGSTTTSYGGTIVADISGNTIQFVSGSNIDANLLGTNQQPRANGDSGSAAADYGFSASIPVIGTALGALRNVVFGATSSPLTIAGNSFTPSIDFGNSSGDLDFLSPVTFGRTDLSSSSGNAAVTSATLQTVGSVQTLTIPVDITFTASAATSGDTSLNFTGQLVATRLVPEPATAALAAIGALTLCRRRR